jgi:hypothetical protein
MTPTSKQSEATLNDREIDRIVDSILSNDDQRKRRHDPVDDFASLVSFAVHCLPGVRNLPGHFNLPDLPPLAGRNAKAREMMRHVARYLATVNPTFDTWNWGRIFHRLLVRRHGIGESVRIRKRPAIGPREDAKRLSFNQLKTKYPDLGRSILYRYLKDAREGRRRR